MDGPARPRSECLAHQSSSLNLNVRVFLGMLPHYLQPDPHRLRAIEERAWALHGHEGVAILNIGVRLFAWASGLMAPSRCLQPAVMATRLLVLPQPFCKASEQ
jgi:hypothetical protein